MKTHNFNEIEFLPSLLDKSKTVLIGPAFFKKCGKCDNKGKFINSDTLKEVTCDFCNGTLMPPKPARHKVGEKIKLMWNSRSKYKYFCQTCLKGIGKGKTLGIIGAANPALYHLKENPKCKCVFNKLLGEAEVTEVFKIEIDGQYKNIHILPKPDFMFLSQVNNLAWELGFKTAWVMFNYYNKKHDLSQPRTFWVSKLRWL